MQINQVKNNSQTFRGFFPTLREQELAQEHSNPYAQRNDLIKPLPPEGHLVKNSIASMPKQFANSIAYDFKAVKKALNGTANDHELGKLDVIALTTGGAALATYLATRKQTASSKAMEFVGVGSFLASMALWPVIAIQIPTKLIHGFNVRQQYKDSLDRQKPFFNDPQYLPWDLYSDEEINKIGDYMKVPQDMNNRRDYIQNKMKKVATQDNTLWMLSAGFAVPIMSALMCNALEQPVKDVCGFIQAKKNKEILKKALENNVDVESSDMYKQLESLLQLNNGKPLNEQLINQICDVITYDSNPVVNETLRAELRTHLSSNSTVLHPEDSETILRSINKNLGKYFKNSPETVQALLPSAEELSAWLKEGNFIDRDLSRSDLRQMDLILFDKIKAKKEVYNASGIAEESKVTDEALASALRNHRTNRSPIQRLRLIRPAKTLNETVQGTLRTLVKHLVTVGQKGDIVKDYIYRELSAAPETTLANVWTKSMKDIFSALNIPWKEMDKARENRDLMTNVVRSSFDRIASDKNEYDVVMKKLAKVMENMAQFEMVVSQDGKSTEFEKIIESVVNPTAENLGELGFKDTAVALGGNASNSEKAVMRTFASDRLLGVKSTLMRIITALDAHRRFATMTNVPQELLSEGVCREVKEEAVECAKSMLVGGHRSDFAVKFFFNGNPHPDYSDTSNIEVQNGKIVNKYFRAGREDYRDVSADPQHYRMTMQAMYDGELHPQTLTALGDKTGAQLAEYRTNCLNVFGDEYYFVRHESFVTDLRETLPAGEKPNYFKPKFRGESHKYKFLLTGVPMEDLAMKQATQKHNARAWLKLFGGIGLGVLALTVGAQFFFGKTPLPREEKVQA